MSFLQNQIKGFIDSKILEIKKPIISIFVSSDDEYRFLAQTLGKIQLLIKFNQLKN